MPPDFLTVSEWVRNLTLTGALIFILIGGHRKWWVWGYQLRELRQDFENTLADCRKDRDEWKTRSLRNDSLIEWAASIAEQQSPTKRR